MVDQVIAGRFDNVLTKGRALLSQHVIKNGTRREIESEPYAEWRNQSLTLLEVVFGRDHVYTKSFANETMLSTKTWLVAPPMLVETGIGTLNAAAEDFKLGHTWTFKEIVHAEVFDDFLEMAGYLISDGGYKDAAAVLAGGVLEEHLRKLSQKHGIASTVQGPPKKATVMNDELVKVPAYQQPMWRKVQGWLDIRNSAAHRHYDDYQRTDVEQMIEGIRDFIDRYPA